MSELEDLKDRIKALEEETENLKVAVTCIANKLRINNYSFRKLLK